MDKKTKKELNALISISKITIFEISDDGKK